MVLHVLILLLHRYLNEHQVGDNINTCRLTSAMPEDKYESATSTIQAGVKFVHGPISAVKATYRIKDRRLTLQTPICDILRTPDELTKKKFKVAIDNTIHRSLTKLPSQVGRRLPAVGRGASAPQ